MSKESRKSRKDWLRAGLRRLARTGVDGVRVEPLAKELGMTKGSFYWHFADRAELLDAMLAEWAESATAAVIARAEEAGREAQVRLDRLIEMAADGYDPRLELALRDWGRRDRKVARVLDAIDEQRMGYLRQLLRESGFQAIEVEVRAFLLYASLCGHAMLPESHGRFTRKRVLRESAKMLASS